MRKDRADKIKHSPAKLIFIDDFCQRRAAAHALFQALIIRQGPDSANDIATTPSTVLPLEIGLMVRARMVDLG